MQVAMQLERSEFLGAEAYERTAKLGEYPIVYLDAHYEKVRRGGRVQDVAILKALGVNRFGTREVLGPSARISEAEVHWRGFLGDLHKRGLRGVELFVSDDHEGLKAARRAVYPSVPWNRCQFHLSKNAQQYARRKRDKPRIAQAMRDIFDAPLERMSRSSRVKSSRSSKRLHRSS